MNFFCCAVIIIYDIRSESNLHFSHQERDFFPDFTNGHKKAGDSFQRNVNTQKMWMLKRRQQLFFFLFFLRHIRLLLLLLLLFFCENIFLLNFSLCPSFSFNSTITLWIPLKGHNILRVPFFSLLFDQTWTKLWIMDGAQKKGAKSMWFVYGRMWDFSLRFWFNLFDGFKCRRLYELPHKSHLWQAIMRHYAASTRAQSTPP